MAGQGSQVGREGQALRGEPTLEKSQSLVLGPGWDWLVSWEERELMGSGKPNSGGTVTQGTSIWPGLRS